MGLRNQLSYVVVEELIWRGLEPAINRFRTDVLGLEPLRLGNSRPYLLSAYQVDFSPLLPHYGAIGVDWRTLLEYSLCSLLLALVSLPPMFAPHLLCR
jgi:hypothetical protein